MTERIRVVGKLFDLELSTGRFRARAEQTIRRLREGRERAAEAAAKAAVKSLRKYTPQRFSNRLASGWFYRKFAGRDSTEVSVVNSALKNTSFGQRTGRVFGLKLIELLTKGAKPHVINRLNSARPRGGKKRLNVLQGRMLRFEVNGQVRFAPEVNHPGFKGSDFIQRSIDAAQAAGQRSLNDTIQRIRAG